MDFSTYNILNFQHMFFGEQFVPFYLLEIILRTTIMYTYTLCNIRLFTTRSISQLTSFELVIVIALGTAVGDPMIFPTVPMIYGMATITTIVLLTKFTSIITERSETLELLIEGQPVMIIKDGELLKEKLHKSDMSVEELFARLRYKGIKNIGQIEYAFIETSGQISVIKAHQPKPGTSTLNHFEN